MATRRGHDIAPDDQTDADLRLAGGRLPGLENVEEELGLWEQAGPDYLRRPGEKGYLETKPMAKHGSSTCVTCSPNKLVR